MIDNELSDGMIINRRYVLGHTPNIVLKRPFSNPASDSGLDNLLSGFTTMDGIAGVSAQANPDQ